MPLGDRFPCVLLFHGHEAHVHPTRAGFWHYACEGIGSRGLAEVRAFVGYGEVRRVGPTEVARWRERLDHEAGLLEAEPIELALPDGASTAARRIAAGVGLLLGLRDERWAGQPFTFARRFAMAYAGVTDDVARRGVEELEAAGVLERVGKSGRSILWRPR